MAVAATEPLPPSDLDFILEPSQRSRVFRHAIVGVKSAQFLAQLLLLLPERPVPVDPTPRVDAPHRSAESIGGRLQFDDPVTTPRPSPVVGEAQQVKRSWTLGWFARIARPSRRGSKGNQPRLGGMDRQAELAKPLRDNFRHALGVAIIAEPNHESSSPGESHPQALTEPDVNLSTHPALIVQSRGEFRLAIARTSSVRGGQRCRANEPLVDNGKQIV